MLTLYNSDKFQTEYQNFKSRAEKITDDNYRKTVEDYIHKLSHQVKTLDTQHEEMIYNRQMDTMSSSVKQKIMELRKTISKQLTDWETRTIA